MWPLLCVIFFFCFETSVLNVLCECVPVRECVPINYFISSKQHQIYTQHWRHFITLFDVSQARNVCALGMYEHFVRNIFLWLSLRYLNDFPSISRPVHNQTFHLWAVTQSNNVMLNIRYDEPLHRSQQYSYMPMFVYDKFQLISNIEA